MSKTKGLSLKQIEKALKKGEEIEVLTFDGWQAACTKVKTMKYMISQGREYRIKPKKKKLKKVVLYGVYDKNCCEWDFMETKGECNTHKITFSVDENNKPILDSVKMKEIK